MIALRAFASGLGQVISAPFTVIAVLMLMVLTVLPFGLVMGGRLQAALNNQPPVMLGSEEIDADWWLEFRRHAEGLDATFTPAIIGFAAPLSNLSALLDGTPQGLAMAGPIAIAIVTWAFIWGWAIERYRTNGSRTMSALLRAGLRTLPRFVAISALAAVAQLLLFLTIHAVLFGPVFTAATSAMADERSAFGIRVLLYAVFGVFLMAVSLVADYSRIAAVIPGSTAIGFLRRWWPSAAAVMLATGVVLAVLFVSYGVGEAYGGSRVGGWRGVAIGQAFIIARLALRLVAIAAEVRLYERLTSPAR